MTQGSQVALVTGASAGIGRATITEFVGRGMLVAAVARGADLLAEAVADANTSAGEGSGRAIAIPGDVSTSQGCREIVAATERELGPVRVLINNAGGSSAHPFLDTTDATWADDLDLKLHAAVRLSRAVVPGMQDAGGGSIINILNTAAKAPGANTTPTSVSRAAGLALTKALSKEYAQDQIRVNAVMIGFVKSAQWTRRHDASGHGGTLDEFYEQMGKRVPIGRVAEASEAASLIGYLTSHEARYVTGASINFDGGMSAVV